MEIGADMVGVVDLVADQTRVIEDDESFWQENYSVPERETDLEECGTEKIEQTNLRIVEWIYDLPVGE